MASRHLSLPFPYSTVCDAVEACDGLHRRSVSDKALFHCPDICNSDADILRFEGPDSGRTSACELGDRLWAFARGDVANLVGYEIDKLEWNVVFRRSSVAASTIMGTGPVGRLQIGP